MPCFRLLIQASALIIAFCASTATSENNAELVTEIHTPSDTSTQPFSNSSESTSNAVESDEKKMLKLRAQKMDQSAQYVESYRNWLANVKTNYDSYIRPNFGGDPVTITISIYIMAFRSVSEVTMDYSMEIYFRQSWIDPRLGYDENLFKGRDEIDVDSSARHLLWKPDTNLVNSIKSEDPKEGSMSHIELIRVSPMGRVLQSKRVSVTAQCIMDLRQYPFDEQICRLYISSYGFTTNDILYEWAKERNIEMSHTTELPDFIVKHFNIKASNASYKTGTFSTLEVCFVLRRNAGYCVVQLLFPATVLVASSWISLWLENEMVFSDVMGVILSILFLSYSYNNVMPKVSYVKGMDVYLGACLMFSFLSLVKMAIVKYLKRMADKKDEEMNHMRRIHDNFATIHASGAGLLVPTLFARKRPSYVSCNGRDGGDQKDSQLKAPLAIGDDDSGSAFLGESKSMKGASPIGGGPESMRVHSREWRVMKAFHYGSQIVLPLVFTGFCVFFFVVYPKTQGEEQAHELETC